MKKKTILVTNDDGVIAPGLKALVDVAREFGEVYVVAPDSPQSGQGHAITLNKPLRMSKVDVFKHKGVEAYKCSGTPADCVKLGKHVLLKNKKVDLCVSGINHGSNASINIIYSGTMSAAMEASLEGIDSIGFSLLDFSWDADFEPAKKWVRKIIKRVLKNGLENTKLLNVNIPVGKKIKGIKVCTQANAHWVEEFQEGKDPHGKKYYWLTGKFVNQDKNPKTDVNALKKGYISVVPSGHDLTKYDAVKPLKFLEK